MHAESVWAMGNRSLVSWINISNAATNPSLGGSMSTVIKRFKHNSESFPIHYENGEIRIYTNQCGEIFIEDIATGVTMRMNRSHYPGGGIEFTTSGRVEPIARSGMVHWRVVPRSA